MHNTWDLDIVWVREMGLEVYALVILSSLVLLAVTVDAQIALIEVYSNLFLFLFNFLNFFSSNWSFFNQLSHIFPVEEAWSRAKRRKCWFCDCRNRGKNIEGIWDSRSCHNFQNSHRLQKKDFSPPFSVQESVKKWGEEYKEAYWFVEGKKTTPSKFSIISLKTTH